MKHTLILFYSLIISAQIFAQKAEPVYSYARENKTMTWYKDQVIAWQKILDTEPKNKTAWYNYYYANRILVNHDKDDTRSGTEKSNQMNALVERMGAQIPDSYEYNFCKWQLGGNDMKFYPFLEKAIALDPNRTEHIDYMINIGEMQRNMEQRDLYSKKKFDAGQFSSGLMYYNYNTIIGLEPNAILLTGGDNDTYPAWALQAKGIRKDVKIINLYLIHIDAYRERIYKELGLPFHPLESEADKKSFNTNLVKQISENKKRNPVYMALTSMGCEDYDANIEDNLYLTGLTYKYSSSSFDNIAILKKMLKNFSLLIILIRVFIKNFRKKEYMM